MFAKIALLAWSSVPQPVRTRRGARLITTWSSADLSERNSGKAQEIFAENKGGELPQRHIDHISLRATNPKRSAAFYPIVYELPVSNERSEGTVSRTAVVLSEGILAKQCSPFSAARHFLKVWVHPSSKAVWPPHSMQ